MFAAFAGRAKEVAQEASWSSQQVVPLIMCTGGFRTGHGMLQAIRQDGIDLVGLGRTAVVDINLPVRLLESQSQGKMAQVACVEYKVTSGEWLKKLVPLQFVEGSLITLWHQLQMCRIARMKEVRLDLSFERLVVSELGRRWRSLLGFSIIILMMTLAILWH